MCVHLVKWAAFARAIAPEMQGKFSIMSHSEIQFGTDGWRATIAQEFTFANVRHLSRALSLYLLQNEPEKAKNGVAIGYDTRFLSPEFARATAETIAECGLPVRLSDRDAPTPALAWETRSNNRATGIMITASHNPPKYNGFKFFEPNGSPADKSTTNELEKLLDQEAPKVEAAKIEEFDPRPSFFEQIKRVIDFDLLQKNPGRVICDFVHGTGRGYLDALLREHDWDAMRIRETPDCTFGGILPDPANPKCHAMLQAHVKAHSAALGLANDPDADRFGIVDSTGTYLTPNQVLALVYVHLLEVRGMKGPVARTVPTTGLLDAIAHAHGQEVIETPVGFKWLGAALEEQGAILGGEESGGLSIKGHLPGKDGILADLLACEIWAVHKKPLTQLYAELMQKYGEFYSTRIDLHLTDAIKTRFMEQMQNDAPKEVGGSKVKTVVTLDGVKLNLEDGSWLAMRPSGTEPIVRVYMEARSTERLESLKIAAQELAPKE